MTTRQYIIAQIAKITAMKNEQLRWGYGMVDTIAAYRRSSEITLAEMNYLDGQTEKAKDKFFKDCTLAAAALIESDRLAAIEREMRDEAVSQMVAAQAELDGMQSEDIAADWAYALHPFAAGDKPLEQEMKSTSTPNKTVRKMLIDDMTIDLYRMSNKPSTAQEWREYTDTYCAEYAGDTGVMMFYLNLSDEGYKRMMNEVTSRVREMTDAAIEAAAAAAAAAAAEKEDKNYRRTATIRQRAITRLASEMWFEHRVPYHPDWTWLNATFLSMGGDYWEYYHEVGAAEMLEVITAAETLAATLQEVL